ESPPHHEYRPHAPRTGRLRRCTRCGRCNPCTSSHSWGNSCLLKEGSCVTDLIRLGFLVGMRAVKGTDHTIQLEAHPGTLPFDGVGTEGCKERFHPFPLKRFWSGAGKDGFQGAALRAVHGIKT